jgi:mannose-6-phosphate isomerase-like protein (cupin superfamily)
MGNQIARKYGARYYFPGEVFKDGNRTGDLYAFQLYHGEHEFSVESGDSVITYDPETRLASWMPGPVEILSSVFAVILRGYQCGRKTNVIDQNANLPYVNGCASRQVFPPERQGDPTLQMLTIPPYTSEQVHHIHSTPRVVHVVSGSGYSIVGQAECTEEVALLPGMTCILDPMSPHHFRTEDDYLTVLPVHVFSSTPLEKNHPMFLGTLEV